MHQKTGRRIRNKPGRKSAWGGGTEGEFLQKGMMPSAISAEQHGKMAGMPAAGGTGSLQDTGMNEPCMKDAGSIRNPQKSRKIKAAYR